MFRETLAHRRTCLRDFPTIFPGNSESEKPTLGEWFMLKLLDPPLLVGIYFTTPEHKNIYMIHGIRGCQKVAKSCNKKNVCKYIHIYVSRPCALCPLLIHILLHHVDLPGQRLGQQHWNSILLIQHPPPMRYGRGPQFVLNVDVIILHLEISKALCWDYLNLCQSGYATPERLAAPSSASSCSFSSLFWFFCFRTISLGHSELAEKGSLRPEWGQDRKDPWWVERIDTRG